MPAMMQWRKPTYTASLLKIESAFEHKYCWWLKRELDWDLIEQAGLLLVGTHDFAGFAASGSGVKTTVRTISNYSLTKAVNGGDIRFTADGFLYNMVRNMVGTLVEIGLGKRPVEDIRDFMFPGSNSSGSYSTGAGVVFGKHYLS